MNILGLDITRPAHACIRVVSQTGKIIYFDPFQVSGTDKADYIFISHEHYDHCSVADIKRIIKHDTVIITVPDCQSKLSGLPIKEVKLVKPGDQLHLPHFDVQVVPAYNMNKHFHVRDNDWVGFVVKLDGRVLYHMGDTDIIPEMQHIKGIDVLFIPVSGTFVMTPEEAAKITNHIKPHIAVPIHYGAGVVGTQTDAEKFKTLVHVTEVLIL